MLLSRRQFVSSTLGAAAACTIPNAIQANPSKPPNILLILVDDMGFSDLGCYGGEIHTPNLDRLAQNGIRYTQFYNAARCCPTRASLLTGQYPHQAGVGRMDSHAGSPAYQGYLNRQSVTLAEVLQPAGYRTYHAGKWHVGREKGQWPLDRGFEKYFGLINGASNFYNNIYYRNPEERQTFLLHDEPWPVPATTEAMWKNNEGFYVTDAFTDYAINFLDEHQQKSAQDPFFLYLAYTAPHWPLHAFPEDIQKYKGKFSAGWDELRRRRYERQLEMGLIDETTQLAPLDDQVPAWDDADQSVRDEFEVEMELYAAMIDRVDQNLGRVIQQLQEMGEYENTLILFLSDNGGCHTTPSFDHLQGTPGGPNSFPCYGYMGAELSNTPFRKYKQFIHEGGIATPMIAHCPNLIDGQRLDHQPGHVIDIMPTLVDLCGAEYPTEYQGHEIQPMRGVSLTPTFEGEPIRREDPLYWEHVYNRGVRIGDWKLVAAKPDLDWELYNMKNDRSELNDLSDRYPEKKQQLIATYMDWAQRNQVKPRE